MKLLDTYFSYKTTLNRLLENNNENIARVQFLMDEITKKSEPASTTITKKGTTDDNGFVPDNEEPVYHKEFDDSKDTVGILKEIGQLKQEIQKFKNDSTYLANNINEIFKKVTPSEIEAYPKQKQASLEYRNSQTLSNSTNPQGRYTYRDNSVELEIVISGNTWTGKSMIVSGFGSENDRQNAQYESGILRGNELYESSGTMQIGYINGNSLTTSVFGQKVTLSK